MKINTNALHLGNSLLLAGALVTSGLVVAQDSVAPEAIADEVPVDPNRPFGSIRVTPTVVRPGVQPVMMWRIAYPETVKNYVTIMPSGTLIGATKKSKIMTVRIAGVSYSSVGTDLPVALWVRVDSGAWQLVFNGRSPDVDPATIVFHAEIANGTKVDFAARGTTADGTWYTNRWTVTNTPNVAALVEGDPLPPESPAFSSGGVEGFMTQFVNSSNELVAGPQDIVYLFELGSDTPSDYSFDMQDIVAVVGFVSNNGHGNNQDGFDVSNPGDSTGVAGVLDTNTDAAGNYIDDEKKVIKAK